MLLSKSEIIRAGIILGLASLLMWAFMIRPHSFDWVDDGHTDGAVKSLMSNTTVIGPPQIKAAVILNNGRQILVDVPANSNVRAGDSVSLAVQTDADKPSRKRYLYSGNP